MLKNWWGGGGAVRRQTTMCTSVFHILERHHLSIAVPDLFVMVEVNIKAISLHCGCIHLSTSGRLQRNCDGILTDCLCFGAYCFFVFFSMPVHFSPSCVCHASSLSPSQLLLPPPFLASSFLRGMEVIDRHPTTCEKKLWKHITCYF